MHLQNAFAASKEVQSSACIAITSAANNFLPESTIPVPPQRTSKTKVIPLVSASQKHMAEGRTFTPYPVTTPSFNARKYQGIKRVPLIPFHSASP